MDDAVPFESSLLRRFTTTSSCLTQADGSAIVNQGLTSVLVSLNGPDAVSTHKELIDNVYIEVSYLSKSGLPCCDDKEKEQLLASVCNEMMITELYPRTGVLIQVQELHNDGCLLSCTVNALVIAFIDAGIPMRSVAAAATCAVDKDGNIILDPVQEVCEDSHAIVTLVMESKNNQMLAFKVDGALKPHQLEQCIDALKEACQELITVFRTYITSAVSE